MFQFYYVRNCLISIYNILIIKAKNEINVSGLFKAELGVN